MCTYILSQGSLPKARRFKPSLTRKALAEAWWLRPPVAETPLPLRTLAGLSLLNCDELSLLPLLQELGVRRTSPGRCPSTALVVTFAGGMSRTLAVPGRGALLLQPQNAVNFHMSIFTQATVSLVDVAKWKFQLSG